MPSLTGFLVWMQAGEVEVKRRLDSASRAIRVMTVHGAKGLEAPVVILPDTAKWPERVRGQVTRAGDGAALWRVRAEESPALLRAATDQQRRKERDERMRLLYVAMTRAESWLIVCAAGETGTGEESWHSLIDAAMDKAGATRMPADGENWEFGPGKRYQFGNWPEALPDGRAGSAGDVRPLPDWINRTPPPAERPLPPLTPTGLGGAKALPGATGRAAARSTCCWNISQMPIQARGQNAPRRSCQIFPKQTLFWPKRRGFSMRRTCATSSRQTYSAKSR